MNPRFRDGFVRGFVAVSWRFRRSTKPATKPSLRVLKLHETVSILFAVLNIIYPQTGKCRFRDVFVWFRIFFVWFRVGFVIILSGFVWFRVHTCRMSPGLCQKSVQEIQSFFHDF